MSNESTSSQEDKELDDVLQIYLPDEYYEDILNNLSPAIQRLMDKKVAPCRQSIAELIPIAEWFAEEYPLDFETHFKDKSAIERAKALIKINPPIEHDF
jgi:hypothetical protein